MGVSDTSFEEVVQRIMRQRGLTDEADLTVIELQSIIVEYKKIVVIPEDPWTQLLTAIESAYNSWHSPVSKALRRIEKMDDAVGTQQRMSSLPISPRRSFVSSENKYEQK